MNPTTLLLATVTLINFFLSLLIIFQGERKRHGWLFGLPPLAAGFWSLGHSLVRIFGSRFIFAAWIPYISASFIFSTLLIFAVFFTGFPKQKRLTVFVTLFANAGVLALVLLPGVILKKIIFDPLTGKFVGIVFGHYYFLFFLYIFFFASFAFILIYRAYRLARGIERTQLLYIFIGAAASAVVGITTNLILPWVGYFSLFWLGPSAVIFFSTLMYYAVVKHKLLNIRIITAELFTGALLLSLFIRLLISQTKVDFAVSSIVFLAAGIFGFLLMRSVLHEVRDKERIEHLAAELAAANEELRRLDAAKSEFISIAGHQLRSPLTVIRGYTSMVLEGSYGKVEGRAREALGRVFDAAGQLVKLVSDLLDLSRIEAGRIHYEFKEMKLEDVVYGVLRELEGAAKEKNVSLEFRNENKAGKTIVADFDKMHEVVINLVDNAIKYSNGGAVGVDLKPIQRGEADYLLLSVTDHGMGIKPEDIPKLFVKFARSDEAKRLRPDGMGLGLYLVKKIVEDHKGRAWVESGGLGQGSTFFVELPVNT